MSATVYVISDTHFNHTNILTFTQEDGSVMRPFASIEEMNEHIIDQWNSVVRPQDHVYHLGDVAMKKDGVAMVARCNGHKRLVRGNHDIFPTKFYLQFFEEIYGVRVLNDLALTHIPLHPDSVKPRWTNVHGHIHNRFPQGHLGPKYFNASVEMIDYTPISLEDLRRRIAERQS